MAQGKQTRGPRPPKVREAIDARDHAGLREDPSNEEGQVEVALDESFPASDPPAHSAAGSTEPAPSSGYDEAKEADLVERQRRVQERAYRHWEQAGRPHGQDVEHWLRAEEDEESPKSAS